MTLLLINSNTKKTHCFIIIYTLLTQQTYPFFFIFIFSFGIIHQFEDQKSSHSKDQVIV